MFNLRVGSPMRFFLLFAGIIIWVGIYLTGFEVVHWFLYLPAAFFVIAAITGFCPGMGIARMIFRERG